VKKFARLAIWVARTIDILGLRPQHPLINATSAAADARRRRQKCRIGRCT
jgi:hypothetical protein